MATLTNAGIPIVDALNAIAEQEEKVELKGIISGIREKVREEALLQRH